MCVLCRSPARMRVRVEVQLPTAPIGYVRVELSRGKVGMAHHLLHAAEIRAALEQMGRERVAQQMWMDADGVESRLLRQPPQDQEDARPRERASLRVEEELGPVPAVE